MTNIISSDQPLDAAQRIRLMALLDTVIPASEDGRMPSAATIDLADFMHNPLDPNFASVLDDLLALLEEGFNDCDIRDREAAVQLISETEPALFQRFMLQAMACYYRDDRTLTGIGSQAGPPFPRGNEIPPGDLSLLDPVQASTTAFRKAPE